MSLNTKTWILHHMSNHSKHWKVQKKKITVLQSSLQITEDTEKSRRNFGIPILKNSRKSLENIHGGAFWFNFSWQKCSTTDGCFWDYVGKPSGWLSVLEMQSLENVEIVVLKKNPWWCTFLILANKALHDYSFPVIFSNISEGLF